VKNFPIHSVLQVIQLISSVLLILAILLQTPKSSSGLGGTIGGGGGDSGGGYRTRRGLENTLFQITIGLTVVFVIVSVVNIKLG
jgi:preprotein translocase subunit SecG